MRNENLKPNDILWNTLGTCTYASVSLLLSIVIINLAGRIEGGIFSFGFSTLARLAFTLTFFGIRPLHIVDVKYQYSFADYINFGIRVGILAMSIGIIYVIYRYAVGSYTIIKVLLLLILLLHGIVDGLADYYECEYQRCNKLYICGQNLFIRISVFAFTLIIVLYLTSNLLFAEASALFAEIFVFYLLNICRSKNTFKTNVAKTNHNNIRKLFINALPLFLITFLDMYIFSLSKFFVDASFGDLHSGFYGLIFMPTNAIYLVMSLFMKPVLTPLSNAYFAKKDEYNKILFNSFIFAFVLVIISLIVSYFIGRTYINVIYYLTGNDYPEFASIAFKLFMVAILGGCFYTLCTPMYYALIIEGKQGVLLFVYIVVGIISFFVVRHFVIYFDLIGAAYGFTLCMFLIFMGVLVAKLISSLLNE